MLNMDTAFTGAISAQVEQMRQMRELNELRRPAPLWQQTETRQVFADASLRNRFELDGCRGFQPVRGYGLDLNGDGKFDPSHDGYLTFDLNGDGRHTDREVARSRDILNAFAGNLDRNADGVVDCRERYLGQRDAKMAKGLDLDGDSILSAWELRKAGASVVRQETRYSRQDQQRTCVEPSDQQRSCVMPKEYSYRYGFGGGFNYGGGFNHGGFGGFTYGCGYGYGFGGFGPSYGGQSNGWQSYDLSSLPFGTSLDSLNPWKQNYQSSGPICYSISPMEWVRGNRRPTLE